MTGLFWLSSGFQPVFVKPLAPIGAYFGFLNEDATN